jgi:hypothetical protein
MKNVLIPVALMLAGLLASCNTVTSMTSADSDQQAAGDQVLFQDSMAENWQENWFLDGEKATLEHRDGGLAYLTEYTVNKNVDREGFDSQHAVLWTREEFEGDIRITYTYTVLPGSSWQKLIYVQAQGVGQGPYVEHIYAWRDEREIAVMSAYFNYMDLIGLSLRDQIRCKRYPWNDMEGNSLETEFMPRAEHSGLPQGRELDVRVDKTKTSIALHIQDTETGQVVVDHTWDLTDEKVLENRDPKYVEAGRIGLRLMGGHKIHFRDFNVELL